ncbi:hypothetical protein ACQ4M3_08605 [Leptolyngbya sp. AN03gr2]|uniref:hypothetical protein n=1 Tax=unclassified Leptolyngbya TaxID=2650499 RepID=UPI003D311BA7
MKLTKSLRTFGLMVMLSAMVGTSMQQSAQAQTRSQNRTQPKAPVSCVPLRNGFFFEFQGITFTPEQEAAFRRFSAELSRKSEAQLGPIQTETMKDTSVDVAVKEGVGREIDKVWKEITDMMSAMAQKKVPADQQVELLTKKYGRYATFSLPQRSRFTPKQIAIKDKLNREFEAQMMSIFTPQQQKVYRENLVIKRGREACNPDKTYG